MIGRGILGSPWKIGEIDYALRENKNFKEPNTEEKLYLIIAVSYTHLTLPTN